MGNSSRMPQSYLWGFLSGSHLSLVVQTDDFCLLHNMDGHTIWVPRSLNAEADAMTKICTGDHFSYFLLPAIPDYIQASFGEHTIDQIVSPPVTMCKFALDVITPNSLNQKQCGSMLSNVIGIFYILDSLKIIGYILLTI